MTKITSFNKEAIAIVFSPDRQWLAFVGKSSLFVGRRCVVVIVNWL